jgi:hypothetical protein
MKNAAKILIILLMNVALPLLNNVKKKKIVSDEKISTMNFGLLTQKSF